MQPFQQELHGGCLHFGARVVMGQYRNGVGQSGNVGQGGGIGGGGDVAAGFHGVAQVEGSYDVVQVVRVAAAAKDGQGGALGQIFDQAVFTALAEGFQLDLAAEGGD